MRRKGNGKGREWKLGIEWDIWDGEWEEKGLEIRDGMGDGQGGAREGHGGLDESIER